MPLRRVEAAATERQGRRCLDAHPASSPPAIEDGHEAMVYQSPKGLDWEVEGVEGIISASLIEEWLGHGLATVDGPTAATLADFRAELCHLELEGQRRFLGGRGGCSASLREAWGSFYSSRSRGQGHGGVDAVAARGRCSSDHRGGVDKRDALELLG